MKLFWHLFAAFGGLSIAYHAWVGMPAPDVFWRILVTGYCATAAITHLLENIRP